MKHDFDRMRCPKCRKMYRMKDPVFLDEINTVVHQKCYNPYTVYGVIDRGTYQEIVERHYFFHELAPKKKIK